MFEGFFTAAGTLILVVGILVLCYFTTRKLGRMQPGGGGGRYIRLLERIVIGQDKTIALVQAGDKYLLLGVASSQITVLMELNKEQLTELEVSQGQTADFKSILEMIRIERSSYMDENSLISINGNGMPTLQILLMMTIISLLPSIVVMMTSFMRIVIILSFTRSAIGVQQTPPNMVLIGLALFLTLFIMNPVLKEINEEAYQPYLAEQITQEEALERMQVPLKEFMLKQTDVSSLELFNEMAGNEKVEEPRDLPMTVVIPSFMTSELKRGFMAGFFIYIPFLLIDIVVSSTLMSMGMIMLPPATIALPFKLLLFVTVNGWELLFSVIVKSFNY